MHSVPPPPTHAPPPTPILSDMSAVAVEEEGDNLSDCYVVVVPYMALPQHRRSTQIIGRVIKLASMVDIHNIAGGDLHQLTYLTSLGKGQYFSIWET